MYRQNEVWRKELIILKELSSKSDIRIKMIGAIINLRSWMIKTRIMMNFIIFDSNNNIIQEKSKLQKQEF